MRQKCFILHLSNNTNVTFIYIIHILTFLFHKIKAFWLLVMKLLNSECTHHVRQNQTENKNCNKTSSNTKSTWNIFIFGENINIITKWAKLSAIHSKISKLHTQCKCLCKTCTPDIEFEIHQSLKSHYKHFCTVHLQVSNTVHLKITSFPHIL